MRGHIRGAPRSATGGPGLSPPLSPPASVAASPHPWYQNPQLLLTRRSLIKIIRRKDLEYKALQSIQILIP